MRRLAALLKTKEKVSVTVAGNLGAEAVGDDRAARYHIL